MKSYQTSLKKHMANYKSYRLGIDEAGLFEKNGGTYRHILPVKLRRLNLLEGIRGEFSIYQGEHPDIKLHKYFHHVNSSQALTFNLFYPFFASGGSDAAVLTQAMGLPGNPVEWHFEYVPDKTEGTNVDVAWRDHVGTWVFCEVKLSEQTFGIAKADERHEKKLRKIYLPRLENMVSNDFLEFKNFRRHYQILRNISLLSTHEGSHVVFLLPRENTVLQPALQNVIANLNPSILDLVHVIYLEELLHTLELSDDISPAIKVYIGQLAEKYVVK